mgnify:CR=1 FL=1
MPMSYTRHQQGSRGCRHLVVDEHAVDIVQGVQQHRRRRQPGAVEQPPYETRPVSLQTRSGQQHSPQNGSRRRERAIRAESGT